MIIDCFPFFNELDILEIRLNELSSFVDRFVLVEASKTQSLKDKPFYFEENKQRFSEFLHKIIHVKVLDYPEKGGWAMENFQRNSIVSGLLKLNLKEDDTILISDADEIPDLSKVDMDFIKGKEYSFEMSYHTFYLNLLTENKSWVGTVTLPWSSLKKENPQTVRNMKDHLPRLNSGWHLGYMGGKEKVYTKFFSCIEPINKNLIADFETFSKEFDRKIRAGGSFLFSDKSDDTIKLVPCDIYYPFLPKYVETNKEKFSNLLFK